MKLIELINTTPDTDILAECARIDERNGEEPYRHALEILHRTPPKPTDFAILLEPWSVSERLLEADPDCGESLILNVSGVHECDSDKYAIEFCSWSEWLDADVQITGVDLTPAQMVAQCLYEMTFISFDPEEIEEKSDEIKEQIEEIKEGRAELVPFDIDEFLTEE